MTKSNLITLNEQKEKLLKKVAEIDLKICKILEFEASCNIDLSDFVKINGYKNYYINKNGKIYNNLRKRFLNPYPMKNKYLVVGLWQNGKNKTYLLHRLVANAFIPNPNNLPQVNHKDFNRQNNCVDNLEWCSKEYNVEYSIKAGRCNSNFNKRKIRQYDLFGNFIKEWECINDASKSLKIDGSNISRCCRKKQKKYKNYIWEYV